MGRYIFYTCLICVALAACKKNISLSQQLTGKWVLEPGTNAINDTLIFYEQAGSNRFFDKSVFYMLNTQFWTNEYNFHYEYKASSPGVDSIQAVHLSFDLPEVWFNVYFRQVSARKLK